ncbi:hypothetical protein LINGRAHAP2_LOCUS25635, partial [Linum grandiflorum]
MRKVDRDLIASLVAYAGYLIFLLRLYQFGEKPRLESRIHRRNVRKELMNRIETHENTYDILRMGPHAFRLLVQILRERNLVNDNKNSSVEEQVAAFLYILGHNVRHRVVNFFFRWSGETISRHFHGVLEAILSLEADFMIQPNGSTVPPEISNSEGRFYPYFKDCVGAIDGTHVRVK